MPPEAESRPSVAPPGFRRRFPVGALAVAIAMHMLVLVSLGLALRQSWQLLQDAQGRYLRLVELRGVIAHYDEVLTMSARMGAASGDPRWEERYLRYEPQLEQALREASRLGPGQGASASVRATDAANQRLVRIEQEAFALVRGGQPRAAQALLEGPAYQDQKRAYRQGVDGLMEEVEGSLGAAMAGQAQQTRLAGAGALLGVGVLLASWLAVISRLQGWRRALEAAERLLEQRVAERTHKVTQQRDELRHLAEQLLGAEQRERRRLAQTLHDHLQQLIVAASLRVDAVAGDLPDPDSRTELVAAREILAEAVSASRHLTVQLDPPALHDGLAHGLRWLADQMARRHRLTVEVVADDEAAPPGEEVARLLFQAARELLFNVVKHAGTEQATVELGGDAEATWLAVTDAGTGLPAPQGRGFGLSTIRQRVEWLSGAMEVGAAPGGGTRVEVRVPRAPSGA